MTCHSNRQIILVIIKELILSSKLRNYHHSVYMVCQILRFQGLSTREMRTATTQLNTLSPDFKAVSHTSTCQMMSQQFQTPAIGFAVASLTGSSMTRAFHERHFLFSIRRWGFRSLLPKSVSVGQLRESTGTI